MPGPVVSQHHPELLQGAADLIAPAGTVEASCADDTHDRSLAAVKQRTADLPPKFVHLG